MSFDSALNDVRVKELLQGCAELARRLRAGEDCRAEQFLPTLPLPALEEDAALELVYTEFAVREELGQRPAAADWYARFPQWRARLERLFHIGAWLEDDMRDEASTVAETPANAADSKQDLKGQSRWIDQYELLEKIGRGGMGVVYKARQTGLNRAVALKMIRAGDDAGAEELARFRREAEDVARLHHPNIVQIYAVGEHDGQPFFTMEYVDGGSLAQKIDDRPQPAKQAAQWLETVARAMHYAHQRGLVHRDLKPGNVVLTADGVPKITDFGLAKRLEGGQTWTRPVLGTPSYISPEQAAGKTDAISPLSDVYSLGTILYELLTGQAPFKGESPLETLELVQHQEPVAPRILHPAVDRQLEAVCLKCLEKCRSGAILRRRRWRTIWGAGCAVSRRWLAPRVGLHTS
jgi:serine/threonine protein kinase